jgi:uncharacterized membrane protein YkoI
MAIGLSPAGSCAQPERESAEVQAPGVSAPSAAVVQTARMTRLALVLLLCAVPARAGLDDYQRAREALERGEVMPLGEILALVEERIDARVIEVEFEQEAGQYVYEFELITPDGRLLEARADAVDGRILSIVEDDD